MKLQVIIVDDEPLARKRLKRFVKAVANVEVVAEGGDGLEAVAAIQKYRPDVAFLDVQMPQMNGFEVLAAIPMDQLPVIIFVTAFDQYALEAFEAHALDYLLKPFGEDRVQQSLERAQTYLAGSARRQLNRQLSALLAVTAESRDPGCLLVKNGGRVAVLRPAEIDWVEADGDYVCIHTGAESHLLRSTLTDVEQRLKSASFVRIHRSRIVNLNRIKEFRLVFRGESIVVLKNGVRLNATHSCLKALQETMANGNDPRRRPSE